MPSRPFTQSSALSSVASGPWKPTSSARISRRVVVQHVFVDGPDVLTWFDLHTTVAPPAPTANWQHIENGTITQIRVAFDPRALTAG